MNSSVFISAPKHHSNMPHVLSYLGQLWITDFQWEHCWMIYLSGRSIKDTFWKAPNIQGTVWLFSSCLEYNIAVENMKWKIHFKPEYMDYQFLVLLVRSLEVTTLSQQWVKSWADWKINNSSWFCKRRKDTQQTAASVLVRQMSRWVGVITAETQHKRHQRKQCQRKEKRWEEKGKETLNCNW